jgi:hypothetical protein
MEYTGWNPTSMPRLETQHAYIYPEPTSGGATASCEEGQTDAQEEQN